MATEDLQIVELLFARDEQALSIMAQKYGKYCRYIAFQILYDEDDAKEIENDAYLKAWQTIPPNRPEELKPYIGMLTRQLAIDAYDKKHAEKRGGQTPLLLLELKDCLPGEQPADPVDRIAVRDLLDRFLSSLPKRTRIIFIRRYWYAESVNQIARRFGMKDNNVAILLYRARGKLAKLLKKEGLLL